LQLLLIRSSVEVPRDAESLFKLLVSPDGSGIIDDTTNHTEGPYEVLSWRDRFFFEPYLNSFTAKTLFSSQSETLIDKYSSQFQDGSFLQSCSKARVTCRAEVTYSKTIPSKFPFPQRSFVKASFFDAARQTLVSKSILYKPLPSVRALLQAAWHGKTRTALCI
jgi:hypothetical protein